MVIMTTVTSVTPAPRIPELRKRREGGFGRVDVHEISWTFDTAPGDLWRAVSAGIANMGAIYLAQDDETRGRMRDAFDDLTASMVQDGELHLPTTALLAQANA